MSLHNSPWGWYGTTISSPWQTARVIAVDGLTLGNLHGSDGKLDAEIDVYGLIANATRGGSTLAVFTSSSGTAFTVAPGVGEDDYIITLADGRVIAVDALSLSTLHSSDGARDTEIDVDGLIANATRGGSTLAVFTSSSGTGFTVAPGVGEDDYIITLADGRVIAVDGQTLSTLHSSDGARDTEIDVDGLIANATRGGSTYAVFTSSSGTAFTVAPGVGEDDYIITLADGRVIAVDALTLSTLHSSDGARDTEIDVDGLIANATRGGSTLAVFTSSSGTGFTVAPGVGEDDYIISLADGRVIAVDALSLSILHSSDGRRDTEIDVDGFDCKCH